jgi:type IV secretion system protein VirD4
MIGPLRFNVNQNQVNGSGDNLSEQSRPLLQVEDIRAATGGETALLESRDHGYFVVDTPNFWERPEMGGYLRDARSKPDKYGFLTRSPLLTCSWPENEDRKLHLSDD